MIFIARKLKGHFSFWMTDQTHNFPFDFLFDSLHLNYEICKTSQALLTKENQAERKLFSTVSPLVKIYVILRFLSQLILIYQLTSHFLQRIAQAIGHLLCGPQQLVKGHVCFELKILDLCLTKRVIGGEVCELACESKEAVSTHCNKVLKLSNKE